MSGERTDDAEVGDGEWVRRERPTGRFSRSLALPDGADPGGIEAHVEHGVLELRVPQSPEQQARRIRVAAGARAGAIDADASPSTDGGTTPDDARA